MALSSIGDLASGFVLRQQSNILKQQITRLTEELSSGMTTDVTRHLAGDFTGLADVNHRLALLGSYAGAADQGRTDTAVMQTSLSRIGNEAQRLGDMALTVATSPGAGLIDGLAGEARNALDGMLSALNVSVAGLSLFAGDETGLPAVLDGAEFMIAIRGAVAGAGNGADLTAAIDAVFDAPGGIFETAIYQGGDGSRASLGLGEGETVSLDLRADDPAFRNTLKEVAIAALLDDPAVSLSEPDRIVLARQVGENLLTGQGRLTVIEADLGFAQARIERAASRISAETMGLNMMQGELLGIDPFEAATELETVQLRLETLYTLTARNARLNLVNFLS